ncbi:BAF_HP2_G0030110.mRNA.1.CDS.1 [Saccharomyces cerevisiae]|nr:BAF_HP2_G0030110.mRNA.1.CDS.1 [Saccharomyces cerevisiae]CAI6454900.1 BAF_HP2_G0030110.mRNA.1.CDS.1 [Saccharomyces cerevisiae]
MSYTKHWSNQWKEDDSSALNLTIDYESLNNLYFLTEGRNRSARGAFNVSKWAQGASPYNPAGINVTIVEMKHTSQIDLIYVVEQKRRTRRHPRQRGVERLHLENLQAVMAISSSHANCLI